MDDLLGGLMIIAAIIAAGALVLYLLALALRFVLGGLLDVAEVVGPAIVLIVLILGLSIPIAVAVKALRTRAVDQGSLITPEAVADDDFFGRQPTGPSRAFGWDRAWPRYVPYQAWSDLRYVASELWRVFTMSAVRVLTLWGVLAKPRWLQILVFVAITLVWYLFFAVVYTAGAAAVLSLLGTLLGAVWLSQFVTLWFLRLLDTGYRKLILKSSARCPNAGCYYETSLPSYSCRNPECTVIHRDVRPGRQGILFHRCECSYLVYSTLFRASQNHESVCPACGAGMPQGVGSRRTLSFPVVGDVGAGKTRFVQSVIVALEERCAEKGSGFAALTNESEAALDVARRVTGLSGDSSKTAVELPGALVYSVSPAKGPDLEVQIVDAAGEYFHTMDGAGELRYLDSAEAIIFVVDPLGVDSVRHEFEQITSTRLANLDSRPEEAYSTTLEALRTNGIAPASKSLAVVVSKADLLLDLPCATDVDPADSNSISAWLEDNVLDNLVTRAPRDFGAVRYFAIDSKLEEDVDAPTHPFRVLAWCAARSGVEFFETTEPVAEKGDRENGDCSGAESPRFDREKATQ